MWDDMLLDHADQDILGTGTVSASLDLKTTKLVNANGWTQENIIETGGTIAGKHQNSLIEILTAIQPGNTAVMTANRRGKTAK